ncbi:MAG: EAL domain-containing protein [Lachnospiraceae bacterium]|nr:EAL domain-containing protein [Lachnospiraceae bacterium]
MVSILIILLLIGVIVFLVIRLREQKDYYSYKSDKLEHVEEDTTKKIEELEKSVEKLSKVAYTDITTKIGNRDYFIKKTIELMEREKNGEFTLIGFGVSNIGTVNQMYGSSEGDRLIQYVAKRLREHAKTGSVYALVQTNLFAILLRSQKEEEIMAVINDLSNDIENCSDIFQVEMAFGIYRVADKSEKISEMLSRMVLTKNSVQKGAKVNYAYFDEELNRKYEENRKMCAEMEQALEDRKFVMYLQPMVDLHIYRIYSAEALVRWEHAEKGLLSPYAFLPLFENTNLMLKLDYYMWEEACKTIRRWIDNKLEPLPLMLNISPIHLNNFSFIQVLSELLARYKLQRDMFVLELPERALTSGGTDVLNTVKALVENGYKICIDNFGGLHSPVNLLRDLPFTMVKLDRKFLTENTENEEGQTILRYLIAMAKELDLTVVTEGVETLEQVNFLTEIGCDIAQGYYFSKPVSLWDFDKLNKKIKRHGVRPNEYYPTFKDFEEGVDIMEKMMDRTGGEVRL